MIYPSSEGVPLSSLPVAPIDYRSSSVQRETWIKELKSTQERTVVPGSVQLRLLGQTLIRLHNENPREGRRSCMLLELGYISIWIRCKGITAAHWILQTKQQGYLD